MSYLPEDGSKTIAPGWHAPWDARKPPPKGALVPSNKATDGSFDARASSNFSTKTVGEMIQFIKTHPDHNEDDFSNIVERYSSHVGPSVLEFIAFSRRYPQIVVTASKNSDTWPSAGEVWFPQPRHPKQWTFGPHRTYGTLIPDEWLGLNAAASSDDASDEASSRSSPDGADQSMATGSGADVKSEDPSAPRPA